MRIEYQLTSADLLAGARLNANVIRIVLFTGGFFGVAMGVTDAWGATPTAPLLWFLSLAAGSLAFGVAMGLLFWFVLLPLNVARIYRENPEFYRDIELVADTDGVSIIGRRTTARFPWPELRGFKENARVIMISKSKSASFTIPKRDLADDVVDALRDILDERLTRLR